MIVGIVKVGSGIVPLEEFRTSSDVSTAVASFCSDSTPPKNTADYLGIDTGFVVRDGRLQLPWVYNFTTSTFEVNLEQVQAELIDDIKAKRKQRLEVTVRAEYPSASGNMFSCSTESQDNWSKLGTLDGRGLVTYPFSVTTYDERASYDLVDSADLTAAIGTVSGAVLAERASAAGYIAAVLAATTEAGAKSAAAPYLDT